MNIKDLLNRDRITILIGIAFLLFMFFYLSIALPSSEEKVYQLSGGVAALEYVGTYLGLLIFAVLLTRYFLLNLEGLLYLSLAFFSVSFIDTFKVLSPFVIHDSSIASQELITVSFVLEQIIFNVFLLFSAIRMERVTDKSLLKDEFMKRFRIVLIVVFLMSAFIIFLLPTLIETIFPIRNNPLALGMLCVLPIPIVVIAVWKTFFAMRKGKNQLLFWFTSAMGLSLVHDVLLFPGSRTFDPQFRLTLTIRTLCYTAFGVGIIADYVRTLIGEKEIAINLEKLVVSRTEELERKNKELEEVTKKSEETARLKSELLANMSHELRTPMNAIIGFTNRVIKKATGKLPDRQLRNLQTVEKNAHHLLSLINSILDVSKVEAGKMEVLIEPFQLTELIDEVLDMATPLLSNKPLKLLKDCSPDIYMNSDRTKIKQMLINLAGNSVKFTDQGGVKIGAKLLASAPLGLAQPKKKTDVFGKGGSAAETTNKGFVQLLVSDTGAGMKEEDLKFIFDEFRQVDGSLTRKVGGTGLGLSIVKKFSILLGGNVKVDSIYQKGTCFTITIPLDSSFAAKSREEIKQKEKGFKRPGVLCVSDNERVSQELKPPLEAINFDLDLVTTQEAMNDLLQERLPNAIVVDLLTRNTSILSVIQQLRSDLTTRDIPCFGLVMSDDFRKGHVIPLTDCIGKPVTPQQLLSTIYKASVTKPVKKALIVDDEVRQHESFKEALDPNRYQGVYETNPANVLSLCQSEKPEIIFIDLMMPQISGLELIEEIKADTTLEGMAIVMVIPTQPEATDDADFRGSAVNILRLKGVEGNKAFKKIVQRIQMNE